MAITIISNFLQPSILLIKIILLLLLLPTLHFNNFYYDQWIPNIISYFITQTNINCTITPRQFELIYSMSGKELFNLGDENQCLTYNMSYNLLMLQKKASLPPSTKTVSFTEDLYESLHRFLDQSYFFYGYCIPSECQSSFDYIFHKNNPDSTIRDTLLSMLLYDNKSLSYFDLSVHVNNNNDKEGNWFWFDYREVYYWLVTIMILCCVIRIIIAIVCFFVLRSRRLKSEAKSLQSDPFTSRDKEKDKDKESKYEGNEMQSYILEPDDQDIISKDELYYNSNDDERLSAYPSSPTHSINRNMALVIAINEDNTNEDEEEDSHNNFDKSSCLNIIYQVSSISKCFNVLIRKRNRYYNNKGIELISFFQMFLLFWLTLDHILYTMILIPSNSIIQTASFFNSSSLIIVKYSVFASDLWIALDGMIMAYKLMSFLKAYIIKSMVITDSPNSSMAMPTNQIAIPFRTFLAFYINVLPKMFLYFLIFILFYYYSDKIGLVVDLPSLFHLFSKNLIQCRECLFNPSIIINPFKIYFMGKSFERGNGYCFKFITVFLNEFTCFTFIIIIIYLALLIRRAWFDWLILILLLLNISLKFLTYFPLCGYPLNYVTLDYIFGSDCSLRYPHLMFNVYLMGFFVGITWFYYKDTIETYSFDSLCFYRPFHFCYNFSKCIHRLSSVMKTVLIVITILVQLLLCCSFLLFRNDMTTDGAMTMLLKIIDCYEKDIFRLVFLLTVLIIALGPDETLLKHLIKEYSFAVIGRIGFCYYCVMDIFIYFLFTIEGTDFQLSYFNAICIAIGNIFLLIAFCVMFVIGFEMPIRMMVKNVMRNRLGFGGRMSIGEE